MRVTGITTRRRRDPHPATTVTTVELFFDLVFVFTITQVTRLVEHDTSARGVGQALLVLAVLWWMYDGYAWLTNAVRPDQVAARLLLFSAMAANLVLALAVPRAFGDDGIAFALAYLVVVAIHTALFTTAGIDQVVRAILRISPYNLAAALLLLAAGFVHGWADWPLWIAAVAIQLGTLTLGRSRGFLVQADHFVERHGLLLIIALGESVVAIGIGASNRPLSAEIVVAIALALAVSAGLWWCYFDGDDDRARERMAQVDDVRRARLAGIGFGSTHFVMIFGIILLAAGTTEVIADIGGVGHGTAPWFIGSGVATYLLGDALYRWLLDLGPVGPRLVAAAMAVGSAALGLAVNEAAQFAVLVLVLASVPITDHRAA